jgi:hypothetical protein
MNAKNTKLGAAVLLIVLILLSAFSGKIGRAAPATVSAPPITYSDNRVVGNPADHTVAYCRTLQNPATHATRHQIEVWGVENSSGFYLTSFDYDELVAAGAAGVYHNLGVLGIVSMNADGQGHFYLAWNGGTFHASGQGVYSKFFTCSF